MADLSISNIVQISLAASAAGLSEFNTANLLLLSTETPNDETFLAGSYRVYKMASEVGKDFGTSSLTYKMALAVFNQTPNILSNNGNLIIALKQDAEESQQEAFNRLMATITFCGFITTDTIDNDLAAINGSSDDDSSVAGEASLSSIVNAEQNKIQFVVSNIAADISEIFTSIKNKSFGKTRCLYYGGTEEEAKIMMAAYASRGMSTVFEGSTTTQTMNLKELIGVEADPSMTQTIYAAMQSAGVDGYVSFGGAPAVVSNGANLFFDEQFNRIWFINALQVAGFNWLRQTNTKIPQTEVGMDGLKSAYEGVCVRGINNSYMAPGSWRLPDTFGDPTTFKNNILTNGYYIYSQPITEQTQADREDRKAPLVQIAIKCAGAVHTSSVMVYVNL